MAASDGGADAYQIAQTMTKEAFQRWAEAQPGHYEFDGYAPVAMGNVSINHGLITNAIHRALYSRLRGSPCRALGPDVGMETVGDAVRNPDAMVTCAPLTGTDYTVPAVVVVFEVLSPTPSRIDRIAKVLEHGAVPTVRRYVVVESTSVGLTILDRSGAGQAFVTHILTTDDVLAMPELGIEIPVAELYEDVSFDA